jgi:diguanylate cyclase (GGDEF)-like protein
MNRQMVELSKEVIESKNRLSFLMIDVDHFKGFNDNFGHEKGDKALIWVAQTIASAAGDRGIPIRYAGDEFIILLPGVSKADAYDMAEGLRRQVSQEKIQIEGLSEKVSLTFSIGLSNYPEDTEDPSQLLSMADKASYNSKRKGRNLVSMCEEHTPDALDASTIYRYFPCKTLVGRDELMKKLTGIILPGREKERPIIVLQGLPGSGKSRILEELHSISDAQRCFLVNTQGASYTVGQPFIELIDPLSRMLKNNPELASKALSRLTPLQGQLILPLLPDISRYVIVNESLPVIDPDVRKEALLDGLKEIVLEISREKPVYIFFDEFHFSNLGTRMLLGKIKSDPRGMGVAVFAAICDVETVKNKDVDLMQFFMEYQEKGLLEKIPLRPLDKAQVALMLDNIIRGLAGHGHVVDFIHRNAEGSPGKVEEILKKLIARKRIAIEKGRLVVEEFSGQDALDTTGILARAGGFPVDGEVSGLLTKASVVGSRFNLDLLKNLESKSEGQLYGILEKAKKTDLISHKVLDEEDVFEFRADELKSDLYTSLEDAHRKDLHRRVGLAEKDKNAEHLEQALSKLAYHFERAGDHPEAMYYLSKLAREFEGLFSPTLLEVYVGKLPTTQEDWGEEKILDTGEKELAVRVCRRLKKALVNLDRYPADSEIVRGSIDSTFQELKKLLETAGITTFSEAEGSLLINKESPGIEEDSDFKEADFISVLEGADLKGISFRKGIEKDEFFRFMDVLTRENRDSIEKGGGWAKVLEDRKITNVQVNQRVFITMGHRELMDTYRIKKEKVIVKEKVLESGDAEDKAGPPLPREFIEQLDIIKEKYAGDKVLIDFLNHLKETFSKLPPQLQGGPPREEGVRLKGTRPSAARKEEKKEEDEESRKAAAAEMESSAARRIAEMMEHYNLLIMDKVKEDIDVLIHELAYPDLEMVQLAGSALLARGKEVVTPLFNYLLDTDNMVARKIGLVILRKLDSQVGKRFLEALIGDTNARQKETILQILREFPEAPLSDTYTILLRDPDARVRRVFLGIIEQKNVSHYTELLTSALDDENEEVVSDAAAGLGSSGNEAAVPHLARLLKKKWIIFNDGRFQAQEAACKALGKIGTDSALSALQDVLKVSPVFFLKRNKPPSVRAAAAFAMGYFPPDRVKEILDRAAKDGSPVVRSAVKIARSMHEDWKVGKRQGESISSLQ